MNKPMRKMVIILAVVFGGIIAFNGIKAFMIKRYFSHYVPPAVTVSSVKAETKSWSPDISAVGNFEAINGVEINSEVSGQIIKLHFDSGQYVQKNTPLLDLDDSVEQATLAYNQADLALQQINYKRQLDLLKRGATPSSSVDESKAKLMQAEANVQKTQAQINQKHIKAPFSGQLGLRKINIGQYVTPGQTEIISLQSLDPLYLKFNLPEQDINKLRIGQRIFFSVQQTPNYVFEGKITAINSRIDTETHNIEIQAIVVNCPTLAMKSPETSPLVTVKKGHFNEKPILICNSQINAQKKTSFFNFIPGMFAAIRVEQPPIPNTIVLPSTAISYSLYGNSVFVIEKDNKDPNILYAKRVFVKTGSQEGNFTVIRSGINSGQEVVSSGELKLQDGTRVEINNQIQLDTTPDLEKIGQ
jgi:membrane fusion protein (multidrug efflux system)